MSREEKILEARRLKATGLSSPLIGAQLGVSDSTVRNWCLGGECVECGSPIDGSDKHKAIRCSHCSKPAIQRRGTGSVNSRALAYLAEPRRCMEIAHHLGISKGHTAELLARLRRYGLVHRLSRGLYQRVDA